jgi:molybdopterin/thiamine biosynthesis adenylyltransferase
MASAILVGAGAIGSQLVPLLAQIPGISAVSIIDRDRYDESNLSTQNIRPGDVGKSKAGVQAGRLRERNPAIVATAVDRAIEDVPLGWLAADVILACLDSPGARAVVNQAAWRLGVPWIDAGVDGGGLLARVRVLVPGPEAGCMECAWDASDYARVDQAYPCQGRLAPAPTAAPSALSSLAAALQAIECDKLLAGRRDELLAGRDVLIDARHHRHYVTAFRRNPRCRMPDHSPWNIAPLAGAPSAITLGDLAATTGALHGDEEDLDIRVANARFALAFTCPRCRDRQPAACLYRADGRPVPRCPVCAVATDVVGFDLVDALELDALPASSRDRSLEDLGLSSGDVVTLTSTSIEAHFMLGGSPCPTKS